MQKDNISFCDIKRDCLEHFDEYMETIGEVVKTADFCGGEYTRRFEESFANYCNVKYSSGVSNGTSAIFLALKALGISEGNEVIVVSSTFCASAWGIIYCEARPVFCDCTPDTWEIDPLGIERLITPNTKAIIGVHLYGQPFDYAAVKKIADEHSIYIIEDCAQSHGAKYRGKLVGGLGEMGCFSFYPTKNLGAFGDAGCITTNSSKYIDTINCLKQHALDKTTNDHIDIGYNMRMDGIQAAILGKKLVRLDNNNCVRQSIAQRYISEITNPAITFQSTAEGCEHVYHIFAVTVPDRERFLRHMSDNGVSCGIHYSVACHLQRAFSFLGYTRDSLPNSEYLALHCVSLPIYPGLTDDEISHIVSACNTYLR